MSEENIVDLEEFVKESDDEADEAFDIGMGAASHGKAGPEQEFEDWADAAEQNKLTDDQINQLKQALDSLPKDQTGPELELGPDGATAWQFFNELGLEDQDLEDKFKDAANVDPETNAVEVFKVWSQQNYPELAVALGMSGTETLQAEPAPEADAEEEQPTAENEEQGGMPNETMPTREAVVKEVAKLVKSRFNEDNPDVGPFNGAPNIALDIKKKCAEMFGDEVGDQCEQLALEFMEKLSQKWEQKHGPIEDDGLSRLKELLNTVKAKVEGIGDVTTNGHAPGNNIMSAEENVAESEFSAMKRLLNFKK